MDPPRLVFGGEVGVVGASGAAGIGEDQDALGTVHECLGFGDIGSRAARLQLLASVCPNNQAARPACDFGDLVDAEPLDDGIERGRDRRECAELFDHPVACGERGAAQHRVARLVEHRLGAGIAVFVGEHRHQPDRKALGEIIDHVFAGGQVDLERFAFFVAKRCQAPIQHGLRSGDQLDDDRVALGERGTNRRQQAREFERKQ